MFMFNLIKLQVATLSSFIQYLIKFNLIKLAGYNIAAAAVQLLLLSCRPL